MPGAEQEPCQRVTQVLHQVTAVDDRHGRRRALPPALGIQATAIPADALDTRMCGPPLGHGQGEAIGQQRNDPLAFKSTPNGPQALPPPPRPCLESDNPWGWLRCEGGPMDETQHRPATARDTERVGQRGPRPAARREAEVLHGGGDARAVATTAGGKGRQALGKQASCTGSVPAEEAPAPYMQADRRPTTRYGGDGAQGGPGDRYRAVLTLRTGSGAPTGFSCQMYDAIAPRVGEQADESERRQQ